MEFVRVFLRNYFLTYRVIFAVILTHMVVFDNRISVVFKSIDIR